MYSVTAVAPWRFDSFVLSSPGSWAGARTGAVEAEGAIDLDLAWRVVQVVVAADHMEIFMVTSSTTTAKLYVGTVGAHDNEVVELFFSKVTAPRTRSRTMVSPRRSSGTVSTGVLPATVLSGRNTCGHTWAPSVRHGFFAPHIEFFRRAVAIVGLVFT